MPPSQADLVSQVANNNPSYASPNCNKSQSPLSSSSSLTSSSSVSSLPSSSPSSPPSSAVSGPSSSYSPSSSVSSLPGVKRRETVIIFDWDDTLLASSFLSGKGCRLDSDLTLHPHYSDLASGLFDLDNCVSTLLTSALNCGEVHIVTNAETGWVQLSAAKFLPSVIPLLPRIHVISARSTYECLYPEQPLQWKLMAFQSRLAATWAKLDVNNNDCEKNIISLGDSHVEREAVRTVTKGFVNTRTKSVKFAERPSMEQLRRQIELVTQCFSYIHNHAGDLDLQLTVTVNPQHQLQQQQQQQSLTDHKLKSPLSTSNPVPILQCKTPISSSSPSPFTRTSYPVHHHQRNVSMEYDDGTTSEDDDSESGSFVAAGELGSEEELEDRRMNISSQRTEVAA